MLNPNVDEITAADIDALVQAQAPESATLDVKLTLTTDRDEFLKDISSFANGLGGQIVYGIREDGQGLYNRGAHARHHRSGYLAAPDHRHERRGGPPHSRPPLSQGAWLPERPRGCRRLHPDEAGTWNRNYRPRDSTCGRSESPRQAMAPGNSRECPGASREVQEGDRPRRCGLAY